MTPVPRSFWRPLWVLLAVGLLAAGCGGDSGDDKAEAGGNGSDDGSSEPADETAKAAFPVDIEHKYGTTTIPAEPERVVTLGLSDHDPVLALGVVPVGVEDWFGERPFGAWPP